MTFHGVRGSSPCHGPDTARYGGNTSCVSLHAPGHDPIIFDLGTGLRYLAQQLTAAEKTPFRGTALLTHLHWDHAQGLPFFSPMLDESAEFDVYGPVQEDGQPLGDAVKNMIRPPMFPIDLAMFPGTFRFHDVTDNDFLVGDVAVRSRLIPHIGPTLGFRVEVSGVSVAYLPDHQQPYDGSFTIPDAVHELCDDVDVLIHDSQYTRDEFAKKFNWGHCTPEFAVAVAAQCRAKKLVMFHHDPVRTDASLDSLDQCGAVTGLEVVVAHEGLTLSLG